MRKILYLSVSALFLLLTISCAKRMDGDFKHDDVDIDSLKKAAVIYYSAFRDNDKEKMYEHINPSSKEKVTLGDFIFEQKTWANVEVDDFKIGEIIFEDFNNASVEIIFKLKKGEFKTVFPFVRENGNWYRRYPTY